MSRRGNPDARCERCRLHETLCICGLIRKIATRTRVLLVIHRFEDRKPTNTGRLATLCLENSEVLVRGHAGANPSPPPFPEGSEPVLLFPHEDAVSLERFRGSERRVVLVVPDGNWRQASRVRNRVPGLRDVPCAVLPPGPPSRYRLRSEPHGGGLATIEAIARAVGLLENREAQETLEYLFQAMVERTLWARGSLEASEVTCGIPEGVKRHDPRSGAPRRELR